MSSAASRRDDAMSIGEVLALLSPDFPDVSVSKIRLWESEGLVEPARTPSGYRKFTHDDVERLRYAMMLQRDHYWPLRKIRDHLDRVARGVEELLTTMTGPRPAPSPTPASGTGIEAALRPGRPMRLSATEMCQRAGISASQLEELVEFGLLRPNGSGWYDEPAFAVAAAAAQLAGFGIEPRHLRAFRTAADREVGLVEQVVSPLRRGRSDTARARADDTARQITAAALRLHAALVRAGLDRAGLS